MLTYSICQYKGLNQKIWELRSIVINNVVQQVTFCYTGFKQKRENNNNAYQLTSLAGTEEADRRDELICTGDYDIMTDIMTVSQSDNLGCMTDTSATLG